jgi:hypothetical protein
VKQQPTVVVRITLASASLQQALYRAKRVLKQKKLYVDDDLTVEEQRIRKSRIPQFKRLQNSGKAVDWRRADIAVRDAESGRWVTEKSYDSVGEKAAST